MRLAVSDKYVGLNINFENMTSTFVQDGRIKIQKQNQNIWIWNTYDFPKWDKMQQLTKKFFLKQKIETEETPRDLFTSFVR